MQTEDMKRLLLKGEIVGYEWHKMGTYFNFCDQELSDKDIPSIQTFVSDDMENWWSGVNVPMTPHDSFEQGIEVNGKWWFEGDRFSNKDRMFTLKYGVFTFHNYIITGWYFEDSDSVIAPAHPDDFVKLKHIGNIHEGKKCD